MFPNPQNQYKDGKNKVESEFDYVYIITFQYHTKIITLLPFSGKLYSFSFVADLVNYFFVFFMTNLLNYFFGEVNYLGNFLFFS